jgi:hypothetical protein
VYLITSPTLYGNTSDTVSEAPEGGTPHAFPFPGSNLSEVSATRANEMPNKNIVAIILFFIITVFAHL